MCQGARSGPDNVLQRPGVTMVTPTGDDSSLDDILCYEDIQETYSDNEKDTFKIFHKINTQKPNRKDMMTSCSTEARADLQVLSDSDSADPTRNKGRTHALPFHITGWTPS